jgi:sugar-specific transcriptional regulator TrmB
MDNSRLLETIKRFGFAEYEAKCYLALFEKESLTVGEIASLAGVPRANIYGIMRKLLAKGFCVSLPGAVKKYSASDPNIFRDELTKSLDESKKTIDSLTIELTSLFKNSRANGSPLEYIEILRNPYQIHRKFMKLCSEAQKEILGFVKPPFSYETPSQEQEQKDLGRNEIINGKKVKGIHELPENKKELPQFFNIIHKYYNSNCEEVKVIEKLPMKLFIFDNRIVMFALEDPVQDRLSLTMLVVEHPILAESLKWLFDSYWAKAQYHYTYNKKKYSVPMARKES